MSGKYRPSEGAALVERRLQTMRDSTNPGFQKFNERNSALSSIGHTDVVVAQTAALAARRALASIAVSRQSAAVSLIGALGGGWDPAATR